MGGIQRSPLRTFCSCFEISLRVLLVIGCNCLFLASFVYLCFSWIAYYNKFLYLNSMSVLFYLSFTYVVYTMAISFIGSVALKVRHEAILIAVSINCWPTLTLTELTIILTQRTFINLTKPTRTYSSSSWDH